MAKAKKKKKERRLAATMLPSGRYRVQVLSHRDPSGKRVFKSFTADTANEAIMMAEQWKIDRPEEKDDITVLDAVTRYIQAKEAVLSPTTIRSYNGIVRNYLQDSFGATYLSEVDSKTAQIWVSDLTGRISPKTVRNAYGLVAAALDMFAPDMRLRVKMPAKRHTELYTPSDKDIKRLLDSVECDPELHLAIVLAAFGTLRRGEIMALTGGDFDSSGVTINKAAAMTEDRRWVIKTPKTYSSNRYVSLHPAVIKEVRALHRKKDDLIFTVDGNIISNRFRRAVERAGLPHFRFHDLRHYSASILHAIGVPDQYIMQRGGWATDNVMKSVYRNVIDLEKRKQDRIIQKHFESIQSGEQHGKQHEAL